MSLSLAQQVWFAFHYTARSDVNVLIMHPKFERFLNKKGGIWGSLGGQGFDALIKYDGVSRGSLMHDIFMGTPLEVWEITNPEENDFKKLNLELRYTLRLDFHKVFDIIFTIEDARVAQEENKKTIK